ncbi:hypothetical protein GX586_07680 [bacterium]|nr:hypothetical protein [bacterium]
MNMVHILFVLSAYTVFPTWADISNDAPVILQSLVRSLDTNILMSQIGTDDDFMAHPICAFSRDGQWRKVVNLRPEWAWSQEQLGWAHRTTNVFVLYSVVCLAGMNEVHQVKKAS